MCNGVGGVGGGGGGGWRDGMWEGGGGCGGGGYTLCTSVLNLNDLDQRAKVYG